MNIGDSVCWVRAASTQFDPEGVQFHSPGRSPGFTKQRKSVALKGRHSSGVFALTDAMHRSRALSGLLAYVVTLPRAAPSAMESRPFGAKAASGHLFESPESGTVFKPGGKPRKPAKAGSPASAMARILAACAIVFFTNAVLASPPWHLAQWRERAVVTIPQPQPDREVDTAAVRILCQGQARPDGADYRVLDASGNPVPFQIMFHDAGRYSLISFRAAEPRQTYYIYYGNPQADRAAEEIVADPAPGAGPPKSGWLPHYGLVYTTLRRPDEDNPKTVAEMAALLAASPGKDGARYQRTIANGFNPFGSSDNYISVYRGWLHVSVAGSYRFCTASNEASFSFLDATELIHWPGRHTAERGEHGEKNVQVDLAAGWHYVEYYHEEVALQQMAFLGWSPPGAEQGKFSGIPEDAFPAPHPAVVAAYQTASGPALRFEPTMVDTCWPERRHEGQYTRVRFSVAAGTSNGADSQTTCHWDFGDGQDATGTQTEHVYLTLGDFTVKVSATGPNVELAAQWPLTVYEVQHVTDEISEGSPADYAKLASTYQRERLDAAALAEVAQLFAEAEQPQAAIDSAEEFVNRFAGSRAELLPGVRRLMADCALQLGKGNVEEAVGNYLASLTDSTPPAERFDVLARLIRLVGIDRDQTERSQEILQQAEAAFKKARLDEAGLAAYRDCLIAAGDVQLWHARRDEARTFYRKAEALAARPISAQVRAAQIGAYPNLIADFIDSDDFGAALDVVDRWERTFPTEKLAGQTFFWRGKLLALRDQPEQAARYLARAIGLAPGAVFESEARWLLAQSLKKLGRTDDARREFAKLIAAGFSDEFAVRARKELSP
jgi:tetratricopeptide (TPR) repeat protein